MANLILPIWFKRIFPAQAIVGFALVRFIFFLISNEATLKKESAMITGTLPFVKEIIWDLAFYIGISVHCFIGRVK